jgi:hypothetical protein
LCVTNVPSSDYDINNLSDCADAATRWHLKNKLLLSPSDTEVLINWYPTASHQV